MKRFILATAAACLAAVAQGQSDISTTMSFAGRRVTGYPNGIAMSPASPIFYYTNYPTDTSITSAPAVYAFTRLVTGTTSFTVGLNRITAVAATLDTPSLTLGTIVTAPGSNFSSGIVRLAVYKPTSSSDTTPILSTAATTVSVIVAGND